jgi:hypothetical protein
MPFLGKPSANALRIVNQLGLPIHCGATKTTLVPLPAGGTVMLDPVDDFVVGPERRLNRMATLGVFVQVSGLSKQARVTFVPLRKANYYSITTRLLLSCY